MTAIETSALDDLFSRDVDGARADFVRPLDTPGPVWVVYDGGRPLGTLNAEADGGGPLWRLQSTHERHRELDDAVRALRRPASWPRERAEVTQWAKEILADESLLVIDLESTGLEKSWAVQIAAVERDGTVVLDQLVNPCAEIEPAATAVHGITAETVRDAPTFSQLLPTLTRTFQGRRCLAFNVGFDSDIVERELTRHHVVHGLAAPDGPDAPLPPVKAWMESCRWEDAMVPHAVWRGLWSAKRGAYRNQRLGGPHHASGDCLTLLRVIQQIAEDRSGRGHG